MTLRGKTIFLKPLNPNKLAIYVDGKATLSELLSLEAIEENLEGTDLSEFHARCEKEPERSYWHVPWIIIRKKDHRGLAILSCEGAPSEGHEVTISFPKGEAFFKEKCEAFELLCDWAAGHDKVYFLRTHLEDTQTTQIAFAEKLRFKKMDETGLYECESVPSAWLPLLLCAGIGLGTGLGEILGSMPLGSALGIMAGFFLGNYLDKKNKQERIRK